MVWVMGQVWEGELKLKEVTTESNTQINNGSSFKFAFMGRSLVQVPGIHASLKLKECICPAFSQIASVS